MVARREMFVNIVIVEHERTLLLLQLNQCIFQVKRKKKCVERDEVHYGAMGIGL